MTTDLLIAPPAGGKTRACLRRIQAVLSENPFAPVRVVLPDRLQAEAFRRRLAQDGGALGVQVGSFGDLYRDLLDLAGAPIPLASPPMAHRLVQAALEQVQASGGLQHFGSLRQTPGFALTLRDAFAELKRSLVYPEDFRAQSAAASPAQQDLARLYQAYQDLLHQFDWADPEGLSWLAVKALEDHPALTSRLALLVVDGFDSFTNAQLRTLQLLAPRLPAILITLPGELPFRRPVHRRFANACQSLLSALNQQSGVSLTPSQLSSRTHLPQPFSFLEAELFESNHPSDPRPINDSQNLTLLEARSPAEEARETLRWIKTRHLRDGISLQDCAIVTPNPDLYHPYLRQAAAEFDLPLRFTQAENLAQAPAVAALLSLLGLPAQNYPRRPLLDAVRSPFFDHTLAARDAATLDEISRYGQVLEGRDQWAEVFDRLAQAQAGVTSDDLDPEDEKAAPSLPRGAALQTLRNELESFFQRLAPPAGAHTLTTWVSWLEDLLDDWQFFPPPANQKLEDERSLAAFNQFRETLRALVLGEAVTGEQTLDYAQFYTLLQGAIDGAGFQDAPLHSRQPALLVMRMIEARGVRFKAAAILGLSEGIFPAVERADPFLDEPLRASLGLESRLQREQSALFYQAVTRADRHLLLSRPYLADDGERWEASPYWKAALALVPAECVKTIRPDDPRPFNDAASKEEALFWAVRAGSLPDHAHFAPLAAEWQRLQHAARVLAARLADKAEGPYEGIAEPLAPVMQARYDSQHVWSASRLETYGTCPQQFYIGQALELKERGAPELGFDAAQLGTLLHSILEQAYAAASNPADPQTVLAELPAIASRVFAEAPLKLGFRPSPLWQMQQEQYRLALENSVQRLAEQGPGWQPAAYELPFGREGAPPLEVDLGGETIRLHGVIDRVDRDEAGNLRIIDYKTGGSHLTRQDMLQGRRLQLPLYALAAERDLAPGKVVEGLYWTLLKGEAAALKLSTFKDGDAAGPQAALDVVLRHLEHIVRGIRQAQFPPVPPKGGCPGYCPAAAWCWRFTPAA